MRIDKLYLKDFRNLKNFEIDFDEESPRTVLVGRNGVGKSNILEALTRIFGQLDLREKPSFAYKIRYKCNNYLIEVESKTASESRSLDRRNRFLMQYAAVEIETGSNLPIPIILSESAFYKLNAKTRILPKHVFGYYSGVANRLRDLFKVHTELYRNDLINGKEGTLRPLFLAEDWHSQFVLLAFFSKADPDIATFLREQMNIRELDYVLFTLNEPHWYKKEPSQTKRSKGDRRFWWAAGTVQNLLSDLYRLSLAPMHTSERVRIDIGRTKTKEHCYCFIKSAADLQTLVAGIDQKEFFKRLESTVMSDLLKSVRIRFRVGQELDSLAFEDLSEGEQQLLTVLGLLRFTNEDESLFLLDEPDTHLNPAWCLDYLQILNKFGGGLSKSQIIMTTHSPLVFAGLEKNEVIILHRREETSMIEAEHPASSPKGMGFSAILTSEFFGLRSALDRETTELLDEKRKLGSLPRRTKQQEIRLLELNKIIGALDFSQTVDDPLYKDFVKAMTQLEQAQPSIATNILSHEDLERRRERAAEALRKSKRTRESDEIHQ